MAWRLRDGSRKALRLIQYRYLVLIHGIAIVFEIDSYALATPVFASTLLLVLFIHVWPLLVLPNLAVRFPLSFLPPS